MWRFKAECDSCGEVFSFPVEKKDALDTLLDFNTCGNDDCPSMGAMLIDIEVLN